MCYLELKNAREYHICIVTFANIKVQISSLKSQVSNELDR